MDSKYFTKSESSRTKAKLLSFQGKKNDILTEGSDSKGLVTFLKGVWKLNWNLSL